MSPKIKQRIRLTVGIVLSVLTVAAGCALILACLSIFNSPEGTFSRETVAEAFGRIAVLVYVAVGGILLGGVLSVVLPEEKTRIKPRREDSTVLSKLTTEYDLASVSPEVTASIHRERKKRKLLTALAGGVGVAAAVPPIVWMLLPGHFGAGDKNQEILVASVIVLGCFALAMLTAFVCGLFLAASCRKERALIKLAIADRTAKRKPTPTPQRVRLWDKPVFIWAVRGSILALSAVFIILGVQNGGMRDVFAKAVRICTECIGLG